MLVPAAVAFVGILVVRRRQPRTDPLRAAALLWAAWLLLTWCFFASSNFINSYYLAAFAPPIAALCGMGLGLAWRLRARRATQGVVLGTVMGGTAYALYLLPTDAGVRPWVWASTLLLAVAAIAVLVRSLLSSARDVGGRRVGAVGRRAPPRLGLGIGDGRGGGSRALRLSLPAGRADRAGARCRQRALPPSAIALTRAAAKVAPSVSVITNETSSGSSGPIFDTGREFLPVGGFTGRVPSPTLAQFVSDVRAGRVAWVFAAVAPRTRNPDMLWAIAHCPPAPAQTGFSMAERCASTSVRPPTLRAEG